MVTFPRNQTGSKSQLPLMGLLNLAKVLEESTLSAIRPSSFGQETSITGRREGGMSNQGKHKGSKDQNGSAGRG